MSQEPRRPKLLTRLKLHEISLVPAPANPGARVLMFKGQGTAADGHEPDADLVAQADALAAEILRNAGESGQEPEMPSLPQETLDYIAEAVRLGLAAAMPKPLAVPPALPPARPSAEAELEKLAKSIMATRGVTYHQAYDAALTARPELYEPAREEGLAKARLDLATRKPSAPPTSGATPAEIELAAIAQAIQASSGTSYAVAYDRALERNPALYAKYQIDKRAAR